MMKIYTHIEPMFAVIASKPGCYRFEHLWGNGCACMSEPKELKGYSMK